MAHHSRSVQSIRLEGDVSRVEVSVSVSVIWRRKNQRSKDIPRSPKSKVSSVRTIDVRWQPLSPAKPSQCKSVNVDLDTFDSDCSAGSASI